ncbi:MAG: 4Fe-4S dicluster domain-containing protein [Pseudomonadota bacterium]
MNRLLIVDLDRCFGCHACEVACKQEKDLPVGPRPMQIIELGPRRINGKVCRDFVPTLCCQCDEVYCMEVCPSGALARTPEGIVTLNKEKCTYCELCVIACPYGLMGFNSDLSLPAKCDFCSSLLEKGLDPSCVSHCPAEALYLRSEDGLEDFLSFKYRQRIGKIVYVSQTWNLSSPIMKREREESHI